MGKPALAQVSVLRGGEVGIEPSKRAEPVGGRGEVVRGKEAGVVGVGVVVRVDHLNDHLADRRVEVIGEPVESPAAEQGLGKGIRASVESAKPTGRRDAIIVGEYQVSSVSVRGAEIAGRRRTGVRRCQDGEVQPLCERVGDLVDWWSAPVIDHDHFEAAARIV